MQSKLIRRDLCYLAPTRKASLLLARKSLLEMKSSGMISSGVSTRCPPNNVNRSTDTWTDTDFRVTQNRHEKARRLELANESSHTHSASSIHFASNSITNSPSANAASGTQARRRNVATSRKDSGHGSINSVTKPSSTLSPLNPRRGGPGSTSTSIMSSTGQMTALSLGAPFASSIQPGMTSSGPMIVNGPKSPTTQSRRILPGLRRN